jgi:hypothetical protein
MLQQIHANVSEFGGDPKVTPLLLRTNRYALAHISAQRKP